MPEMLDLDFVLSFCREMIPGKGEDSYCHSFCDGAGMVGVFDGCGGAGARTHDFYSGHTEAYMASRLCAGAFYDAFQNSFPCRLSGGEVAGGVFAPAAIERLKRFAPPQEPGSFVMKGSLVRTLPTTAAVALVQADGGDRMTVSAIWAGDSRVYLLDREGLAQLTVDDTSVPDPMENLYEDGVLRNVLCSDREVKLHCATVDVRLPFVVLAATDGCFGYVSTPMEFEAMVLGALLASDSPEGWQNALADAVSAVAGDDHALCAASFGFGGFDGLKRCFRPRMEWLRTSFLQYLAPLPLEDRATRYALWEQYRGGYLRMMKGGAR